MRYIVCIAHFYCFFAEYINSFKEALKLKLLLLDHLDVDIYNEDDLYIFIRAMPSDKFLCSKTIKAIFLNTEQLTRPQYIQDIKKYHDLNIPVIDYSLANIKLAGQGHLLRYQYNPEEINALKQIRKSVDQSNHVGFTGGLNDRRMHVLREVCNLGFNVTNVQLWGIERDKELLKSKVIINIHYDKDYKIYESIRCDRLLFAGVPVLTENSIDQDCIDTNILLASTEYETLAEKTKEVLDEYENISFNFEYIQAIAEERKADVRQIEDLLTNL